MSSDSDSVGRKSKLRSAACLCPRGNASNFGNSQEVGQGILQPWRRDAARHYLAERVQSPPESSKDDSRSLWDFHAASLVSVTLLSIHSIDGSSKISRPNQQIPPRLVTIRSTTLDWIASRSISKELVSFRELITNDRKKRKKNKWKIFNKSRIRVSENIFVPANFLRSRDKNFILSKCTRIYKRIYIYTYGKLKQHGVFTVK